MSSVTARARRLILVVDADADARTILATVLTSHEYAVASVTSAADAARIMATIAPDLVLLDVAPDTLGDPIAVTSVRVSALRAPLVLMSTSADRVSALWAEWGATAALCKPFEIRALLDLVELLCADEP